MIATNRTIITGLFACHTYLFGMIGLIGGLSLAMSGTNSTLVRAVNPPRLQNVTWSAVTCNSKVRYGLSVLVVLVSR